MALNGKLLITAEKIAQNVTQWGCDTASQKGVAQVLGFYNNFKNLDLSYSYRAAFEDLMRLHDGLRAVGCVSRETLDGPMKATYRLAELHKSLSKPAIPYKQAAGMGGVICLAGLTPPGAIVAGIAAGIGALGMAVSGAYEMFGD